MTYKVDGEKMGDPMEMEYKIKDGKLYATVDGKIPEGSKEMFKINSFKITADGSDIAATCGLNMGIMIASAVVAGLGALMTAFCVTILVLDRKGKFNA